MSFWSRARIARTTPSAVLRIHRPTWHPTSPPAHRFCRSIRRFAPRPSTMSRSRATGRRLAGGRYAPALASCWPCVSVWPAIVWQSYGDAAKQIVARWVPQFALTSSSPQDNPGLPEQASSPPGQASAANAAAAQPASPGRTAPEGVASTGATLSPESTQLLQSMAGDLAHAEQEIEQLKASIAQLKASQQQMSRDIAKVSEAKVSEAKASEARVAEAKVSEQNLRSRLSAAVRRSAAASARKPMPPFPPPQAAAAPPCRRPPHLRCRSNNRKPRLSRRPNWCRGRRCPCASTVHRNRRNSLTGHRRWDVSDIAGMIAVAAASS